MTIKLTDEMRLALQERPGQPLEIEDEQTHRVYLLIARPEGPEMIHASAHEAIQAGIDDMEASRVVTFEEVDRRIRAELGLPPQSVDDVTVKRQLRSQHG